MARRIAYKVFLNERLKERVLRLLEQSSNSSEKFNKEILFYFLSLISERPANNKRYGVSDNGYTKLNAKLLQQVTHDYKRYIDFLKSNMIIDCDCVFKPGIKSYGYRIIPKLNGLVDTAYIKNPALVNRMRNQWKKNAKRHKYPKLRKWFDGIEIDYREAFEFIVRDYEEKRSSPSFRDWDWQKGRYKNPVNQYNSAFIGLNYIKDKRLSFFVDDKVGRLHTTLTNLNSKLRNFITWNGQQLVSIDITNCQPYLLCKLFDPAFYEAYRKPRLSLKHFTFERILVDIGVPRDGVPGISLPPLMLEEALEMTGSQSVIGYLKLVRSGRVYEQLEVEFSNLSDENYFTRAHVKSAVFQVLFTDNRYIGQEEAWAKRLFRQLFPEVYNLLAICKKGDKTRLPCLLQRIEAYLILDVIANRISTERPNIPILTIHDSIVTTVENEVFVKKVMDEELYQHIGVHPNLKTEYWRCSRAIEEKKLA